MAEKKSHLPHEVAFGGAIPKKLADEFKAIVAEAGWSHKRALAAAVMVFVREARGGDELQDTQAPRWYHEAGAFSRGSADLLPKPVTSSAGETAEPPKIPDRSEQLRIRAAKALRDARDKSAKTIEGKR